MVTLGCARNEVDSEELAGRLAGSGWTLTDEQDGADVLVVNTCGFVDAAKKDSIDAVLAAADTGAKVVAVGCLAERYGRQLAESLPEADAVLGFDAYADIAERLDDVVAGRPIQAHVPRDRRTLLPISPTQRPHAVAEVAVPGHAWLPAGLGATGGRKRLDTSPVASLKLASGCDRRCTFCAIPSFRGSFVSRPPADVLAEARWLAGTGVREIVLVSENSTSYGKDLGDLRTLERLLPELGAIDGVDRVRVAYLQPAELRPGLIEVLASTPGIAPYFDLSFQHASPTVLRRMKRFGGTDAFLDLLARARALAPAAGARSNVIVGFPGETEDDVAELARFLAAARLDGVGVFGYSSEDGTEAESFPGQLDPAEIAARVEHISALADELVAQRAEDRIGESVAVLVEDVAADGTRTGRGLHQGPEDGTVSVPAPTARIGDIVTAVVVQTDGADLVARVPADTRLIGACRDRTPAATQHGPDAAPARFPAAERRLSSAEVRISAAALRPPPPDPINDPVNTVSDWNIANALTLLRILLVPVFAVVLFTDGGHHTGWRIAACGVFAVASITDRIDGELARRRHLVTELGKLADPIADKALIGMALIGLSALGELAWWVTVVVLARELAVTGSAVLGDPARGHPGQSRRQGEDAAAGRRHRAVRAAAVRCAARAGCRGHGRGRSFSPSSPARTT